MVGVNEFENEFSALGGQCLDPGHELRRISAVLRRTGYADAVAWEIGECIEQNVETLVSPNGAEAQELPAGDPPGRILFLKPRAHAPYTVRSHMNRRMSGTEERLELVLQSF